MKNKFNLLSGRVKLWLILFACMTVIPITIITNSDYLQTPMFGQWHVTQTLNYGATPTPRTLKVSGAALLINDRTKVSITYSSRHASANFERDDQGAKIKYYFSGDDSNQRYYEYLIIYDRKHPGRMELVTYSGSGEVTGEFIMKRGAQRDAK